VYLENKDEEQDLIAYIHELSNDFEFKDKELFVNMFSELMKYLPELSRKELKQRVSLIRTFIE
jgi:hypothetical protein